MRSTVENHGLIPLRLGRMLVIGAGNYGYQQTVTLHAHQEGLNMARIHALARQYSERWEIVTVTPGITYARRVTSDASVRRQPGPRSSQDLPRAWPCSMAKEIRLILAKCLIGITVLLSCVIDALGGVDKYVNDLTSDA